jgi:phosphotransferase system HPr (HPr) family protein
MELSRTLTIRNELGLHARTATQIARLAEGAHGRVYLVKDARQADATDILDMMGLYCPQGTEVTVGIDDPSDMEVLQRIAETIEGGFGESTE